MLIHGSASGFHGVVLAHSLAIFVFGLPFGFCVYSATLCAISLVKVELNLVQNTQKYTILFINIKHTHTRTHTHAVGIKSQIIEKQNKAKQYKTEYNHNWNSDKQTDSPIMLLLLLSHIKSSSSLTNTRSISVFIFFEFSVGVMFVLLTVAFHEILFVCCFAASFFFAGAGRIVWFCVGIVVIVDALSSFGR